MQLTDSCAEHCGIKNSARRYKAEMLSTKEGIIVLTAAYSQNVHLSLREITPIRCH